jgi:hypothetical protein
VSPTAVAFSIFGTGTMPACGLVCYMSLSLAADLFASGRLDLGR